MEFTIRSCENGGNGGDDGADGVVLVGGVDGEPEEDVGEVERIWPGGEITWGGWQRDIGLTS